jgi:menaquinone-specific isochorismate synthase
MTLGSSAVGGFEAAGGLRRVLERHSERGGWHSLILPVPTWCDPLSLPSPSVLFDAGGRDSVVGVGLARSVAAGTHAMAAVIEAANRHYEQIRHLDSLVEAPGAHAPWIGGLAFADAPITDPVWSSFPTTGFMVPRWTFRRAAAGWQATLTLGPEAAAPAVLDRLVEEWAEVTRHRPSPPARAARGGPGVLPPLDRAWLARIGQALEAIETGRVQKVVLARHLDFACEHSVPTVDAMQRLAQRFPSCTRFLVTAGASAFFGASPEVLIRQQGLLIETEAVAGSCTPDAAMQLFESEKDRREHALVVEAIVSALQAPSASLTWPDAPRLRQLANVAHLVTPIQGTLARPGHILDLVTRLHPTPATAGTPTADALALLRAIEPVERGWYAGPIGWFDDRGDGHFVVGLRSAVRTPATIRIYAGSGIVRGSDPRGEMDEMAIKMRAMREVLGGDAQESVG